MSAETILIASDHAGYEMKQHLAAHLRAKGFQVQDLGTEGTESVDYPDFGIALAEAVAAGKAPRGVLVCGTGIGMSIAANRHPGVRAALCGDVFSAKMTRAHNDANVLCIGARVVGEGLALEILDAFLGSAFEGGRHQRRIDKIDPSAS